MATNDFLAFATGGNANVTDQGSWAQDSTVSNGFFGGVAPSAKVNKAIRQPSFVGASISEWVNQQLLTVPIRDDGIVQEWVDNFDAALRKLIEGLTRRRLTAPLDLYVSATGSDTEGDGLTPATAWATPQYAYSFVMEFIDMGGYGVTIHLAPGTYSAFWCIGQPLGGQSGVWFVGDEQNPQNVLINGVNTMAVYVTSSAVVGLAGMRFQATGQEGDWSGNGSAITAQSGQVVIRNVDFGTCSYAHMVALGAGSIATGGNSYSISAGAENHVVAAYAGGIGLADSIVNIFNNPHFSSCFCLCEANATQNNWRMTFQGTATGVRAMAFSNGIIGIGGVNPDSYFPGDQPSQTGSGGQIL